MHATGCARRAPQAHLAHRSSASKGLGEEGVSAAGKGAKIYFGCEMPISGRVLEQGLEQTFLHFAPNNHDILLPSSELVGVQGSNRL